MKYVQTDSNHKILGFYDNKISEPPEDSKEISDKDWQNALDIGANHFESGQFSIVIEPLTQAQQLDEIGDYVASMLETEMKDTKYFFGYGFKYGRDSVARYPTDEEAIKLTAWQKAIWQKCSIWRSEIAAGTLQISTLTESYVNENLPNIDDF